MTPPDQVAEVVVVVAVVVVVVVVAALPATGVAAATALRMPRSSVAGPDPRVAPGPPLLPVPAVPGQACASWGSTVSPKASRKRA
ncbi:hypothetical protein GCM10009767_14610 [Kocuria aegyptia]|uniref:Secreted protein n=1 Tax=Kocuria aegyptia TaxID=330943 RepID=A0ABP4WJS6_9MICC